MSTINIPTMTNAVPFNSWARKNIGPLESYDSSKKKISVCKRENRSNQVAVQSREMKWENAYHFHTFQGASDKGIGLETLHEVSLPKKTHHFHPLKSDSKNSHYQHSTCTCIASRGHYITPGRCLKPISVNE
jgi:hypothetical protein